MTRMAHQEDAYTEIKKKNFARKKKQRKINECRFCSACYVTEEMRKKRRICRPT